MADDAPPELAAPDDTSPGHAAPDDAPLELAAPDDVSPEATVPLGHATPDDTPFIPADADLEGVRRAFARDRFATEACGIRIDEASFGRAVCSFAIEDRHRNAMGAIMGGAIFTLADFCLAVVSNIGQGPSVSINASIEHLAAPRGSRLIATAQTDRQGRSLGFYTIDIHDDTGIHVARVMMTVFKQRG